MSEIKVSISSWEETILNKLEKSSLGAEPWRVVCVESVDSTMDEARLYLPTLSADEALLLIARDQKRGRGRQGRSWNSCDGNLYVTYVFNCANKARSLSGLSLGVGLSIANAIKALGCDVRIKWPNDLLIGGKKIGGVLCESKNVGSQHFMAIGVGLNVNMTKEVLEQIGRPATSIIVETGEAASVESVKQSSDRRY